MRTMTLTALALALFGCITETQSIASDQIYVVDGDTIKVADVTYRLTGYDTPETYRAKCSAEKRLGDRATARLRKMISAVPSVTLEVEAGEDKYGRRLAQLSVAGRDAGSILISEGLARPYCGGKRSSWC